MSKNETTATMVNYSPELTAIKQWDEKGNSGVVTRVRLSNGLVGTLNEHGHIECVIALIPLTNNPPSCFGG